MKQFTLPILALALLLTAPLALAGTGQSTPCKVTKDSVITTCPRGMTQGTNAHANDSALTMAVVGGSSDSSVTVRHINPPPHRPSQPPPPCNTTGPVCGDVIQTLSPGNMSITQALVPAVGTLELTPSGDILWGQHFSQLTNYGHWLLGGNGEPLPSAQAEQVAGQFKARLTDVEIHNMEMEAPGGAMTGPPMNGAWMNLGSTFAFDLVNGQCYLAPPAGVSGSGNLDIQIAKQSSGQVLGTVHLSFPYVCGGCFTADTQIELADGRWIPMDELTKGEKIRSFVEPGKSFKKPGVLTLRFTNLAHLQFTTGTVIRAHSFWANKGVSVDGLRSTPKHVYFAQLPNGQYGFTEAYRLAPADHLVDVHKQVVPITNVHTFTGRTRFTRVSVDVGTLIVRANASSPAILVHNASCGRGCIP